MTEPATPGAGSGREPARSTQEDTARHRLLAVIGEEEIDLTFVAREAGDLPMEEVDRTVHARVRRQRGDAFHRDLVFALTHRQLEPARAARHWSAYLERKAALERQLGRPVAIGVAALDYLHAHPEECDDEMQLCPRPRLVHVADVALRDGLTGLFDHRTFMTRLAGELDRHRRYGEPVSVVLADLDHFKRVNDEHGHLAGDAMLREVARVLSAHTRQVDTPARYGGDELALLMPRTGPEGALDLAERIRAAVADRLDPALGVTLSAGVASCPEHGRRARALVEAADEALYAAKQAGRDRVGIARSGGAEHS